MKEIIFATGNTAKLEQLRFVAASLRAPVQIVSARERFGSRAHYDEQGLSATVIAQRGAQALAQRLNVSILTEDTTFHVDALGGRPGVKAGDYLRNKGRNGILAALESVDNRRASIVSAVAWATPNDTVQTWMHRLVGEIARAERWSPGRPAWVAPTADNPLGGGYNAIFIPDGLPQTLAQVPPEDAIQLGYREPNFCAAISFVAEQD